MYSGNLHLYDTHLKNHSSYFLHKRAFLALERARQCCLRQLFLQTVTLYTGTRIPIEVFSTALTVAGSPLDREETECIVANMIYRGWMKGYISRERGTVVLSAKDAFPKISGTVAWIKV
jgi:COP9 signalosome complex subunit 12